MNARCCPHAYKAALYAQLGDKANAAAAVAELVLALAEGGPLPSAELIERASRAAA